MKDLKVSTVLSRAAKRLKTKGWRRGAMGPLGGPNCLMGAIIREARDCPYGTKRDALDLLADTIHAFDPERSPPRGGAGRSYMITLYNDKVLRTQEDAVFLMEQAAFVAKQAGE